MDAEGGSETAVKRALAGKPPVAPGTPAGEPFFTKEPVGLTGLDRLVL